MARARDLAGPVRVASASTDPGVTADPVTVPAAAERGELVVRIADDCRRPFTVPLVVRAVADDETGPVVAEAKVTLVD